MASANITWIPKEGTKIPFTKVFAQNDAALIAIANRLNSLRPADAGYSLSARVGAFDPESTPGFGWRVCLHFSVAGRVFKVCIEHVDAGNTNPNTLAGQLVAAGLQSEEGASGVALVLVKSTVTRVAYV